MLKYGILATFVVVVMSGTASAGVYLGLGIGTTPSIDDEMEQVGAPSSQSVRGIVGVRLANVSVEGALNGFDMATRSDGDHTMYQASAALKLNLPIGGLVEAFGRAGVERTWINLGADRSDLAGNGFLAGVGIELRLNLLLASVSAFVDYTVHRARLESSMESVGATSQVLGVGLMVGLL